MKIKIGKYRKKGKPQKIKIHIDSWDTWGVDTTLALIITPMLKQLRDTTHGYPSEFMNDGNIPEDYDNQYDDYDDEKGMERWKDVLNQMIYSFEVASEGYPIGDVKKKGWIKKQDIKQKKVQEGFDLFGKYYMALWD